MYELDAIAAAVIGGTSLSGGVGTISGTVIGAFVIGILRNGLNMGGVSAFIQQIVIGLVILLTVWIDQMRHRSMSRRRLGICPQSRQPNVQITEEANITAHHRSFRRSRLAWPVSTATARRTRRSPSSSRPSDSDFWQNVQEGRDRCAAN